MRKTMLLMFGVFVAGSTLAPIARADRPAHEFRSRREVMRDRKQEKDDRLDLARLELLLQGFDKARAAHSTVELIALDAELRGLVEKELKESRHELRSDIRDAKHNHEGTTREKVLGRKPFDRRDRNTGVRDVSVEIDALSRKQTILGELESIAGRPDEPALSYRRERIVALIGLARAELHNDRKELKDDLQRFDRDYPNKPAP
jgi:hypothetical protein